LLAWCSLLSCSKDNGGGADVKTRSLGHASEQLLVAGWTMVQVKGHFGEPHIRSATETRKPAYGLPADMPEYDQQWVYIDAGKMTNTLVYFRHGRVVLAIREWTDF
jgi:hypothetical protein